MPYLTFQSRLPTTATIHNTTTATNKKPPGKPVRCRSNTMPNKWTETEDRELRRLVACFGQEATVNWVEIARRLPGRNNKDCRKRWTKISEQWRKGSWDEDENALLRRAVARHGSKWIAVAEVVQTRSPDQCQKRWQNALNPDLSKKEWSIAEDEQLKSAVGTYGRNWASISKQLFPDRAPLDLSNRYTSLVSQLETQSGTSNVAYSTPPTTTSSIQGDSSSLVHDTDTSSPDQAYTPAFAYDNVRAAYPSVPIPSQRFSHSDFDQYPGYRDAHEGALASAVSSSPYLESLVATSGGDTTSLDAGYYSASRPWPDAGYTATTAATVSTSGGGTQAYAYADPHEYLGQQDETGGWPMPPGRYGI